MLSQAILAQHQQFAEATVRKAGEVGRKYYSYTTKASSKDDESPITIADELINALIIREAEQYDATIGVLGEASRHTSNRNHLWVCDPIDGTIPYMLHIPISTCCLALVVDGEPVVGLPPCQRRIRF